MENSRPAFVDSPATHSKLISDSLRVDTIDGSSPECLPSRPLKTTANRLNRSENDLLSLVIFRNIVWCEVAL
jgi:hypothetical protein